MMKTEWQAQIILHLFKNYNHSKLNVFPDDSFWQIEFDLVHIVTKQSRLHPEYEEAKKQFWEAMDDLIARQMVEKTDYYLRLTDSCSESLEQELFNLTHSFVQKP